jgi:diadenosine tetraphosphate (Ap4A) HIT family hydrolase
MPTWMPPDEWAALKRGDGCVLCEDAHQDVNVFGSKIADLTWSWFRLANNQYLPGWTVVTLKRHATELFQLAPDELAGYWADVARAARALDRVFQPAKINYLVMGNICPHIHCHLVPRFYSDDPTWPVNMNQEQGILPPDQYAARLDALRQALTDA